MTEKCFGFLGLRDDGLREESRITWAGDANCTRGQEGSCNPFSVPAGISSRKKTAEIHQEHVPGIFLVSKKSESYC